MIFAIDPVIVRFPASVLSMVSNSQLSCGFGKPGTVDLSSITIVITQSGNSARPGADRSGNGPKGEQAEMTIRALQRAAKEYSSFAGNSLPALDYCLLLEGG